MDQIDIREMLVCLAEIRGPDPETAGRILQTILQRLRPPDAGPPQKNLIPP